MQPNTECYIDAVIRGDAEVPIVELCGMLQEVKKCPPAPETIVEKLDLRGVPNLVWRAAQEIVSNEFTYVAAPSGLETLKVPRSNFYEIGSITGRFHGCAAT